MPAKSDIDDLFADPEVAEPLRQIMVALRELVLEAAPGLAEISKWGAPSYVTGPGKGMEPCVCYIAPYSAHVNLGFHHGAGLGEADPEGLLKGAGKGLRHVQLKSVDEVEAKADALRALVRAGVSERS